MSNKVIKFPIAEIRFQNSVKEWIKDGGKSASEERLKRDVKQYYNEYVYTTTNE